MVQLNKSNKSFKIGDLVYVYHNDKSKKPYVGIILKSYDLLKNARVRIQQLNKTISRIPHHLIVKINLK